MKNGSRTIEVGALARVEGEGALYVKMRDGQVDELQLRIYEPPRFFEALLQGRSYMEAADITARICGICPVAYQMSTVHAVEDAFGATVDGSLRELRRLIYCGEWIESHALHIYMLHGPDFLGYAGAVEMAKDHPDIVKRGLELKKAGNEIIALLGGREIHPINVRPGGFYRVPTRQEVLSLANTLERAHGNARETLQWVSGFDFPTAERDFEFVALQHPDEYPFNEGRIVSSAGLDIASEEFLDHIEEFQVPHSTALHARMRERGEYAVGPAARYSLNFDRLSPAVQAAATAAGLGTECRNPFRSIVVRAVEVLHACEEALRLIDAYQPPPQAFVALEPRPATGHAATEAPRGLLYHRYQLDPAGLILDARIIPPTSQNQAVIEDDLRSFVEQHPDLDTDALTWQLEQAIRNYDPCISCSTHFLELEIDRE